jgi:hypothetical protein
MASVGKLVAIAQLMIPEIQAASFLGKVQHLIPGAGMTPSEITPFVSTYMDGFREVACIKDSMLLHADKFGDGKYSYEMGDVSNVSIVNYDAHVLKEDRKEMTHAVCFDFCRTIKHMSFFGLTHGRDCYCTPYFKQIPGDSSDCDAVCEGDTSTMCGGMSKSSVFEMHSCNDAAGNLQSAADVATNASTTLGAVSTTVMDISTKMQSTADILQKSFGNVGDSAATASFQAAKVFAGILEHASEDGTAVVTEIGGLLADAPTVKGDQSSEALTASLAAATKKAGAEIDKLDALAAKGSPGTMKNGTSALYYPIMYFVDKAFVDVPSTCGGTPAADPIVGSFDECSTACEAKVGSCVGFGYFAEGLCFLFSEFQSATYYTGCDGKNETKCVAKFANFEGETLAPDASGKCKKCLKKASKADRCFA